MSAYTRNFIIGLSLATLLSACADMDELQDPAAPEQPAPTVVEPAAEPLLDPALMRTLDETTEIEGPWLFAFETEPEIVGLTLHGTDQARLAGRVADRDGRREIVYYGAEREAPKTIFDADWLLPAVGAASSTGEMLVCVNRLVGEPSDLTKGDMPDPAGGVDLVCRWSGPRGWTRELVVPRRQAAALWLSDVVALRDGSFRITYSKDMTGLLVDDPTGTEGDGVYRLGFDRGRFGEPEMAHRFRAP